VVAPKVPATGISRESRIVGSKGVVRKTKLVLGSPPRAGKSLNMEPRFVASRAYYAARREAKKNGMSVLRGKKIARLAHLHVMNAMTGEDVAPKKAMKAMKALKSKE
jgi:hypothetical protein